LRKWEEEQAQIRAEKAKLDAVLLEKQAKREAEQTEVNRQRCVPLPVVTCCLHRP
jgi:hypothetical protein